MEIKKSVASSAETTVTAGSIHIVYGRPEGYSFVGMGAPLGVCKIAGSNAESIKRALQELKERVEAFDKEEILLDIEQLLLMLESDKGLDALDNEAEEVIDEAE